MSIEHCSTPSAPSPTVRPPPQGVTQMWRDPWPAVPPNGRPVPEPGMGGTEERLIGYGLVVTGAAGILVWLSGQLAGLLFAHTWLHVGVADMPEVLWHLPKHP